MRKYLEYTESDIIEKAKQSRSLSDLIKKLGLRTAGGNFGTIKKKLKILNVDTSHWKGQGWNRGEQLKDWENYKRPQNLKHHLIKEKGYKCQMCELTKWNDKDIILEVHHIDGNRLNNKLTNLQLLCPNCHSTTDNWRNRKRK